MFELRKLSPGVIPPVVEFIANSHGLIESLIVLSNFMKPENIQIFFEVAASFVVTHSVHALISNFFAPLNVSDITDPN